MEAIIIHCDRGTYLINDVRRVADGIILESRGALCSAPAVGQPVISVVLVPKDFRPGLIQLISHPAELVEMPCCGVAFAVGERQQVSGGAVNEAVGADARINLEDFSIERIVKVVDDVGPELVRVTGRASNV